MLTIRILKGGSGSGNFGHAGREGEVGGSASANVGSSIQLKIDTNDPYVTELAKYVKNKLDKEYRGTLNAPDVLYHLGHRVFAGQGNLESDYAMAKYIESKTDRETMLEVMNTQYGWTMSPRSAAKEWSAMHAITGANVPEQIATVELTDKELEGYKARQEFVQAYFESKYGKEMKMYRGVAGPYANKIKKVMESRKYIVDPNNEYSYNVHEDYDRKVKVKANGLTSWTNDAYNAQTFASKRSGRRLNFVGVVLETMVHSSDVWIMPRDVGVVPPITFMEDAGEVVTINRDKEMNWSVNDWAE